MYPTGSWLSAFVFIFPLNHDVRETSLLLSNLSLSSVSGTWKPSIQNTWMNDRMNQLMKAISEIIARWALRVELTWGIGTAKVSQLLSSLQYFDIGKHGNIYLLTVSEPYAFYFDISKIILKWNCTPPKLASKTMKHKDKDLIFSSWKMCMGELHGAIFKEDSGCNNLHDK